MTELEIRQGYSNGTLTDCDECGETMRAGSVCIACAAREEESSHAKPSQAVDDKQIDVHIWKNNEWVLLEGGLRNAKKGQIYRLKIDPRFAGTEVAEDHIFVADTDGIETKTSEGVPTGEVDGLLYSSIEEALASKEYDPAA
jgi:hypothetical protein